MSEQERRILAQAKENVLEKLRRTLTKCLEPQRHFAYLRAKGILNLDDQERIQNTCFTTSDRASKFIDILETKGPTAFDELYNSIKSDGTQTFLLQEMNRCFEEQIEEIRIQMRGRTLPTTNLLSDDNLPGPRDLEQ